MLVSLCIWLLSTAGTVGTDEMVKTVKYLFPKGGGANNANSDLDYAKQAVSVALER